ncbi:lytic transglycosylase domain-containing protein [Achromobacter spanius]|uniref:Transglycosylase SLT domain-containing protein n=1 Tax=Achromobacter spanius TaxID=217203 RepID=A0AAW3I5X4_9BURK|nr:lytic transglycosylase domain-containing protein [Achromobacter spanius]KNE28168.1 hypothetical protein AFM18_08360 [Achromobacter spanius]
MTQIDERRVAALAAASKPVGQIVGEAEPSAFAGVASEVPRGVALGSYRAIGAVADLAASAYQPLLTGLERATGVEAMNPFSEVARSADQFARVYMPDPLTTGMAGQLVNGVASVITQVGLGAGAALASGGTGIGAMWAGSATAGGATGRGTYQEMTERGVDANTALNAAFVDAVATGGGALLPGAIGYAGAAAPFAAAGVGVGRAGFVGLNAAYGAASNMALGIAQRGSIHNLLKAGGYDTMAEQYKPMDAAALAAEGILGGVFAAGGAAAGLSWRAQGTVDAALAARDSAHANVATAPGIPTEPGDATAHRSAMDSAVTALAQGREVDMRGTGVDAAAFLPRASDPTPARMALGYYADELPASQRYFPSRQLTGVAVEQRRTLRYDAAELNEYAAHIEQEYELPAGLINALKNAGERSNSNQTSPAGARGVMQFMPENLRKYGVTDATDPVQMIDAAGRYLRDTMRQYGGNVDAMIADYNGGPRQAREVLAGRQPKAKETRDYLARVREWMGRDSFSERGQPTETLPRFPAEQARAAAAIDQEVIRLEGARAEMLATGANEAELGQVARMRDELAEVTQMRQGMGEEPAIRARAKEIQGSESRVSYKQALSRARKQISQEVGDVDARIQRLEASLEQNRDAAQALQRLGEIDARLADLRETRAAIDAPAAARTPISAAIEDVTTAPARSAEVQPIVTAGGQAESAPVRLPGESADVQPAGVPRANAAAAGVAPVRQGPAVEPAQPSAMRAEPTAQDGGRASGGQTDIETQAGLALLDEQGDIRVLVEDENGGTREVSLREELRAAEAELEYGTPEALNAAVMCALMRGG